MPAGGEHWPVQIMLPMISMVSESAVYARRSSWLPTATGRGIPRRKPCHPLGVMIEVPGAALAADALAREADSSHRHQ